MREPLGNVIAVEERPLDVPAETRRPDEGVVISRGTRVYLRTFTRTDLAWLGEWVDDPFLERMVGSEFLHAFKHDWDKAPAFHDTVMNDPTQVVLMVEARRTWGKPVGVVRLFNIHLLEGYAFLETIITDQRAMRHGYGVEAGKLISYYGVDVLGIRRIEAKAYAYNVLSTNTLRRNGFKQEGVLHIGVLLVPPFWYPFVLIFLDATPRHRPSLAVAYGIALVYSLVNLSRSPLFMKGVVWTHWGWAPATGPLYLPTVVTFFFFMIYGLRHLVKANKGIDSSFRRNRGTLIMLGVLISLAGAFIDFARFVVAKSIPAAEQIYPMGIPANMIFAVMLGTSIVRYRLFDVSVAVKKTAVYVTVGSVVTAVVGVVTWSIEQYYDLMSLSALWAILPLSFVM